MYNSIADNILTFSILKVVSNFSVDYDRNQILGTLLDQFNSWSLIGVPKCQKLLHVVATGADKITADESLSREIFSYEALVTEEYLQQRNTVFSRFFYLDYNNHVQLTSNGLREMTNDERYYQPNYRQIKTDRFLEIASNVYSDGLYDEKIKCCILNADEILGRTEHSGAPNYFPELPAHYL